jgi:aryl-alcohol dehydrogenase
MKVTAAVVRKKGGPFLIEELELEDPREDEILIKVVACGLCHTDLVARDQHLPVPLPGVFGHEGAGVVEKVGSRVTKVSSGDHVVMSFLSCGTCPSCKKGVPTHCDVFLPSNFAGQRLADGSTTLRKGSEAIHGSFFGQSTFSSHALVSERNIVKVPNDIPLEMLGPLGCGIQTGAGGVINTLKASPGSSIAVFGAGSVGISAIMASVVSGCTTIVAVDINEQRLETAKTFGATHVLNSSKVNPTEEIQKMTGGGIDYALECTGIASVLRQAFDSLCMGGICGLIGAAPAGSEVSLDMQNILNGRTLVGIVEGDSIPEIFIPQLIELYKQGRFPFDRMVTYYPFADINKAAEDSEKGKALKAILKF